MIPEIQILVGLSHGFSQWFMDAANHLRTSTKWPDHGPNPKILGETSSKPMYFFGGWNFEQVKPCTLCTSNCWYSWMCTPASLISVFVESYRYWPIHPKALGFCKTSISEYISDMSGGLNMFKQVWLCQKRYPHIIWLYIYWKASRTIKSSVSHCFSMIACVFLVGDYLYFFMHVWLGMGSRPIMACFDGGTCRFCCFGVKTRGPPGFWLLQGSDPQLCLLIG